MRRDLQAVKKILEIGNADPHDVDNRLPKPSLTAFQLACLIFRPAAEEIPSQFANRSEEVCFHGDTTGVKDLTDADFGDSDRAAHFAAAGGHSKVLKQLKKERVQGRDNVLGLHPMECAAANGHLGTVQWFTQNASDVDPILARSCMKWAAWGGHLKVVQWLYQSGGANQISEEEGDCTAMLLAASEGHLPVVQWLIKKGGSSLTEADWYGRTALAWAALKGHMSVVQWTHQEGGDKLQKQLDMTGKSVVLIAASGGDLPVLQWLLINGDCTVKEKDLVGRTALLWAAHQGHLEMVQWLVLGGGSCTSEVDEKGNTAAALAASQGHSDVVYWLVQEAAVSVWSMPDANANEIEGLGGLRERWTHESHYLFPRSYRTLVQMMLWAINMPQPNPDEAPCATSLTELLVYNMLEFLPSDALPHLLQIIQPSPPPSGADTGRRGFGRLALRNRTNRPTNDLLSARTNGTTLTSDDMAPLTPGECPGGATASGSSSGEQPSSSRDEVRADENGDLNIWDSSSDSAGTTQRDTARDSLFSPQTNRTNPNGTPLNDENQENLLSPTVTSRNLAQQLEGTPTPKKKGYLKRVVNKMAFCVSLNENDRPNQQQLQQRQSANNLARAASQQQQQQQQAPQRLQYHTNLTQVGVPSANAAQGKRRNTLGQPTSRRVPRNPGSSRRAQPSLMYHAPQRPRRTANSGGILARPALHQPGPMQLPSRY